MITPPYQTDEAQRRTRQSSKTQLYPQPRDDISNVTQLLHQSVFPFHASSLHDVALAGRTLYPSATSNTKMRPSPISPVRAVARIFLTTSSTRSSGMTRSIMAFGKSVTLYSVPRYTAL